MSLAARAARLASRVLDPTILLSFDRTGYRLHRASFRPGDLDVDLGGRVAVVTGAGSGIGKATATALAARGAEVHLVVRDLDRGQAALAEIRAASGSRRLHLLKADVSEPESICRATEALEAPRVHVLVNNAAVLPDERRENSQGVELVFATNVLGPFLLTSRLLPRLLAAGEARVVDVASGGMYAKRLNVDDWNWTARPFDGMAAYAEAKRALVILAEMWAARLAGAGVSVNAMHPGWADTPAVRTSLPRFWRAMRPLLRTPEEGADTVIWLAACPRIAGETGRFWFDREPRPTHLVPWTREDPAERERLWARCESLVGPAPPTPSGPPSGRSSRSRPSGPCTPRSRPSGPPPARGRGAGRRRPRRGA